MEDEKTVAEPIPFPQKEAEPSDQKTADKFQASRDFIEAMNRENETYSVEGLNPESPLRSPVFGTLGEQPVPEPVDWLPATGIDPIQFLIDRVEAVIMEASQIGTEPLSTKAGVLAALYQAQALRQIADLIAELTGVTEDGKTYIRTMRVYRQGQSSPSRRNPQDISHRIYVSQGTLDAIDRAIANLRENTQAGDGSTPESK